MKKIEKGRIDIIIFENVVSIIIPQGLRDKYRVIFM